MPRAARVAYLRQCSLFGYNLNAEPLIVQYLIWTLSVRYWIFIRVQVLALRPSSIVDCQSASAVMGACSDR